MCSSLKAARDRRPCTRAARANGSRDCRLRHCCCCCFEDEDEEKNDAGCTPPQHRVVVVVVASVPRQQRRGTAGHKTCPARIVAQRATRQDMTRQVSPAVLVPPSLRPPTRTFISLSCSSGPAPFLSLSLQSLSKPDVAVPAAAAVMDWGCWAARKNWKSMMSDR